MQRTRVDTLGKGRLILPTLQARSSALSWATGPTGGISTLSITATLQPVVLWELHRTPALPIVVALRTAATLLPEALIRALSRRLLRPTSSWSRVSGPL
jgi:hypothetical protein